MSAVVVRNFSCGPAWALGIFSLFASMRRRRSSFSTGSLRSEAGDDSLSSCDSFELFIGQAAEIGDQRLSILAGQFQPFGPAQLFALGLEEKADGAEVGGDFSAD